MKSVILILFFALFLTGFAPADDLTLKDGHVLKDYSVLRKTVDALHISHADGVSKVSHSQLPADLRAKYDWSEQAMKDQKLVKDVTAMLERVDAREAEMTAVKADLRKECLAKVQRDRVAEAMAEAKACGPFKVAVLWVKPGMVVRPRHQEAGHVYTVAVRNVSPRAAKASLFGTVYLRGLADDHKVHGVHLAPEQTAYFDVPSVFSPGPNTTVMTQFFLSQKVDPKAVLRTPADLNWTQLEDAGQALYLETLRKVEAVNP